MSMNSHSNGGKTASEGGTKEAVKVSLEPETLELIHAQLEGVDSRSGWIRDACHLKLALLEGEYEGDCDCGGIAFEFEE